MRTEDALEALVWGLEKARDDCRNNAACCLANLAASSLANQAAIAAVPRTMAALVDCCARCVCVCACVCVCVWYR